MWISGRVVFSFVAAHERSEMIISEGNNDQREWFTGGKDRTVVLPEALRGILAEHVEKVSLLHASDLREGFGEVFIPEALARKYPNACREPGWQYVFPAKRRSIDPRSGKEMRHHVLESGLQKAVKTAVGKAGIK